MTNRNDALYQAFEAGLIDVDEMVDRVWLQSTESSWRSVAERGGFRSFRRVRDLGRDLAVDVGARAGRTATAVRRMLLIAAAGFKALVVGLIMLSIAALAWATVPAPWSLLLVLLLAVVAVVWVRRIWNRLNDGG